MAARLSVPRPSNQRRRIAAISSLTWASRAARFRFGCSLAKRAALRAARAPKTSSSVREFEPSRLAPLMLTQAHSPAANRPGRIVAPSMFVLTPPIM
jgi:hypothetical protein